MTKIAFTNVRLIDPASGRDEKGELIPPELQSGMLGMSESFAPHSAEPLNFRMPEDKKFCQGRPVNGYQRRIVDPETGEVFEDEAPPPPPPASAPADGTT